MTEPRYEELRPVTPLASVVLARNPSPMTLEGTNTWVLRAPDAGDCIVIDPGEDDERTSAAGWPSRARWHSCCSPTATTTTPVAPAASRS